MKDVKTFILITLCAILLSFITYWQFKNFQRYSSGKFQLPKFEIPKIESFTLPQSEEYKEFVNPDGKLKLKYPGDWVEMDKRFTEMLNQGEVSQEGKVLFYASKFRIENPQPAFLIIQELDLAIGKSPEEIIEALKQDTEEKGREMEIINLETENGHPCFEVKYKKEGVTTFHSKEEIIFTENKIYLISVLTLDTNWQEMEKEADEILSSIELIP